MKRILFIACLALPVHLTLLYGQDQTARLISEVNNIAARNSVGSLTYRDITGSPYYSDKFTNSTVFLRNGDSAALPLRYDLYQDEVEFQRDGTVLWLIKSDVRSIRYGNQALVAESLPGDPGRITYFFASASGPYSLYVRKKVDFSPYVPPQAYAQALPDRFDRLPDEYYLKMEGKPPTNIKNKKALLKMLGDNSPALDFIKKSKNRVTDEADLLELVNFLNLQ